MTRHVFDAASLPLTGVRIIEASAGTGKTYSLIALFLRTVAERGLRAEQVLLVTFTEAATADLRRRLDEALRRFTQFGLDDASDPYHALLREIRARVDNDALVRARLLLAAQTLDRAAISTIHGFCARALREQAFAAGLDLDAAEAGSQTPLWREATLDFWRAYTSDLPAREVAQLREAFKDFDQLARRLQRLAARADDAVIGPDFGDEVARLHVPCEQAATRLRELLSDDAAVAQAANEVANHKALSKDKRSGLAPARVWAALKTLREWREGNGLLLPATARALSAGEIASNVTDRAAKQGLTAPSHPLFDAIDTLWRAQTHYQAWRVAQFFRTATLAVRERVRKRQLARGLIGFDDLIERLAASLSGPRGARLAQLLRRRYPLAMVDEFQDTDARQYAIFRRLYFDEPDVGLILIGDPKQAIYRFRGGDVYAYGAALRDAGDQAHTLDTNWRSEPGVVAAVNAVFGRHPEPFGLSFVPFAPVKASTRAEALQDEATAAAMVAWVDDGAQKYTRERFESLATDLCADEIARLLGDARAGRVRIGERALRASDIAVLVRSNQQADILLAALNARGVRASLAARGSVLTTAAAAEVETWLAAAEVPDDPRRVRAAMMGPGIGADSATLADADQVRHDEWAGLFAQAAIRQRDAGPLAGWWPVLHRLAPNLLARGGATHLAQLRHVLEWIDANAPAGAEPGALRAWFARRRAAPDGEDRGEALAAIDDGDRVRLITIHRSKGLEFGIVFAPFLWQGAAEAPRAPFDYHDGQGQLRVQWIARDDDPAAAQAEREALDEEIRLAYVALTRAVHRVYVCCSPQKTARRSALARLIYAQTPAQEFPKDAAALIEPWTSLGASVEVRACELTPHAVAREAQLAPQAAVFTRQLLTAWSSLSFSSLHQQSEAAGTRAADHDLLPAVRAEQGTRNARLAAVDFGECFHAVMEDGLQEAASEARWGELSTLHADQYALGVNERRELATCVAATRAVKLAGDTRLDQMPADAFIVEMPFVFALAPGAARRAARALRQSPDYAHLAEVFEFAGARLQGQMRGYVDLIARVEGRYYVLDYKTNRLATEEGYGDAGMARAMREHGYDLQYLIYSVALHRHLRLRLGARYEPARDLGGIVYLFVRGIGAAGDNGIYRRVPTVDLLEALDAALWAQGQAA